jgi:hypothetical protein
LKIFIPTYKREGKQFTLAGIPKGWLNKTYLVCPKEEVHDHPLRVDVPVEFIGSIAKTRQFIIDQSDDPQIAMLDDDLTFYKRDEIVKTQRSTSSAIVNDLFHLMNDWLDQGDVFCGTSNSFMSHEKPTEYYYGKPSHCCFLNRDYLKQHNIRYDAVTYFEDFHVPISVIESGKRLRYSGEYISIEKKANAEGGCSVNRTKENNREAMIELQKLHPNYITLKEDEKAENQNLQVGLKMRIEFKKLYDEFVLGKKAKIEYGSLF